MLKSFVSEEDYPKLINILKRIHNKTLKDDVSILNIYGSFNSGKTTLCTIMATIGSLKRISLNDINFRCASPKFVIDALKDDAVLIRDVNFENVISFPDDITLRERYHSEAIQIKNHATLIVDSNVKFELPIKTKRKTVHLHLPNKHQNYSDDIVTKSVEEFNNIIKEEAARKAAIETIVIMKTFLIKDMAVLLGKYVYETKNDSSWLVK